ncbi:MAG TPA: AMP-binding protein [Novosphingobium sp.]|nr:AMP-binding protein [Novosphingobium sp.]
MQAFSRSIAGWASSRPDHLALALGELNLTFAQLDAQIRAVMARFEREGLRPGDRVAFLGANHPRFFALMLAAIRSGLVLVPINWRQKPREIAHILTDSAARMAFCDSAFRADLDMAAPAGLRIVENHAFDTAWLSGPPLADAGFGDWDRPSVLLYTSGTTGAPKGVETTERAITLARCQERALPAFAEWTGDEVLLSPLPLFHIGGISWAVCGLERGCTLVLTTDMTPGGLLDTCLARHVTRTFMVPQLVRGLVGEMLARGVRAPDLAAIHYGAAAMDPPLLRRGLEQIGCKFLQYFGMTEMCGTITILEPQDHDLTRPELLGSVGKALPGIEIQIRDAEGRVVPRGVPGEIWVGGETMMAGYLGLPDATAEAIADGFYRSGDGGRIDAEGFLYLTDRIKDMINSAGENVYPIEVETVLREHPEVADCAVYGVPDTQWGEMVCAAVELRPGATGDAQDIIAHVRREIAAYKCPKRIEFVEALPRTASGKVQRAKVRQAAIEAVS